MRNTKRYFSVAAVTLLAAATTFAGPGSRGGHGFKGFGGPGFNVERMATVLELTPAQQQQITALQQRQQDATKGLREQMKALQTQLRDAMKAGNASQIESLSQQQGALMGKMRVAGLSMHNELRNILTPEQQKKLDALRQFHGKDRSGKEARRGASPASR